MNETNEANAPEVLEMFRVNGGAGIDLKGEVVSTGVFEETVHRVQKLI